MQDILYALRTTIRRPALALLVAALFGLGIAVATSLWAVVDAVFVRPLPFVDADRLVTVLETHPERGLMAVTPANFLDWAERVPEFEGVAAASTIDSSLRAPHRPGVMVASMAVTGSFFSVLGTPPALGRAITAVDVTQQARVAVLSHRLWRTYLNAPTDIAGTSIRLNGEPFEVIGVMPDAFRLFDNADAWTPLRLRPDEWRERRFHLLTCIARLRPGSTSETAERSLASIYAELARQHTDTNRSWSASVTGLRQTLTDGIGTSLLILSVAVSIVIAVACVNVASLLTVYLPMRRSEFLIRIAVGATIGRIVRQILAETLLWALGGLAAGLLGATFLLQLFGRLVLPTAWQFDFQPKLDLRVAAAMVLFLIVVALLTAVIPSVLAIRRSTDLIPTRAGRGPRVVVRGAAMIQVTCAVLLLTLTLALLHGYRDLATAGRTQHGHDTIAVRVALPENRYADGLAISQLFQQLFSRLTARPEVRAVAGASYVPPEPPRGNVRFTIDGVHLDRWSL